jgi:hypothetical protein
MCLSYFPNCLDAHYQKAKLYIKGNDMGNAIKTLKNALKLTKDPY